MEYFEPKVYGVCSNTTDLGRVYECKVAAIFSFLLINEPIMDMQFAVNLKNSASFDDVVIGVKLSPDQTTGIMIQLKHSESSRPITFDNLFGNTKDFSIIHYYNAFKLLQKDFFKNKLLQQIVGKDFNQIYFLLYSNRVLQDNLNFLHLSANFPVLVLNTGGHIHKIDKIKLTGVFEGMDVFISSMESLEDFVSKLNSTLCQLELVHKNFLLELAHDIRNDDIDVINDELSELIDFVKQFENYDELIDSLNSVEHLKSETVDYIKNCFDSYKNRPYKQMTSKIGDVQSVLNSLDTIDDLRRIVKEPQFHLDYIQVQYLFNGVSNSKTNSFNRIKTEINDKAFLKVATTFDAVCDKIDSPEFKIAEIEKQFLLQCSNQFSSAGYKSFIKSFEKLTDNFCTCEILHETEECLSKSDIDEQLLRTLIDQFSNANYKKLCYNLRKIINEFSTVNNVSSDCTQLLNAFVGISQTEVCHDLCHNLQQTHDNLQQYSDFVNLKEDLCSGTNNYDPTQHTYLLNVVEQCDFQILHNIKSSFKSMFCLVSSVKTFDRLKSKLNSPESKMAPTEKSRLSELVIQCKRDTVKKIQDEIASFLKSMREPLFDRFLEKLYMFTGQKAAKTLDEPISREIRKHAGKLSNVYDANKKYLWHMSAWATGQLGNFHTITRSSFMKQLSELYFENYIHKPSTGTICKRDDFDIETWRQVIQNQKLIVVEYDKNVIECVHFYVLKTICSLCGLDFESYSSYPKVVEDKSALWTNLKSTKIKNEILRRIGDSSNATIFDIYISSWKCQQLPVILCIDTQKEFDSIIETLSTINCDLSYIVLCRELKAVPELKALSKLSDLKNQDVIMNRKVIMQGKPIFLKDIIGIETCTELISTKDLINICCDNFSIGFIPDEKSMFYIAQNIPKILFHFDVCVDSHETLVIENMDYQLRANLEQQCPPHSVSEQDGIYRVQLHNHENIFIDDLARLEEVLSTIGNRNVHVLQYNKMFKNFTWIKSKGSVRNITRYLEGNVNPDFLIPSTQLKDHLDNRVNIISAGPGMGKTTMIEFISKQDFEKTWILKVNLNSHFDYYKSSKFKERQTNATGYLKDLNESILKQHDCYNDLSAKLFEKYLENDRVLILLDGFDEIVPWFEKEITQMVSSMTSTGNRMILTTRPVMQTHVEINFRTIAMTLNPFSLSDQISYLKLVFGYETLNYLRRKCVTSIPYNESLLIDSSGQLSEIAQERIETFSKELLKLSKQNLRDWDHKFTGVPLQCRLLAEVFLRDVIPYVETGNLKVKSDFDLLYLYETMVQQKLDILEQKCGDYMTGWLSTMEKYQKLRSLSTIFPGELLTGLDIQNQLAKYKDVIENLIKIAQKDGITIALDEFNLSFVHRTFAEYFSAIWICDFGICGYEVETLNLMKELFHPNYVVVKNVADRILSRGYKLHTAILNKEYEEINSLIGDEYNVADRAGRLPIHVAAGRGATHPETPNEQYELDEQDDLMQNIVKVLLEKHEGHVWKDEILQYTPLDYALQTSSFSLANLFENMEVDIDVVEKKLFNILYYSCRYGYTTLIKTILGKLANCVEDKASILEQHLLTTVQYKTSKKTLVEIAAIYEHFEIVGMLLSVGKLQEHFKFTDLHIAVLLRKVDKVVEILKNNKNNLNVKDDMMDFQLTPLHYACNIGVAPIVKTLLSYGPSINVVDSSQLFKSNMYLSSQKTESFIVDVFDETKKNNKNNNGRTPLHYAALNGHHDVVRMLLEHGANQQITTRKNGILPIHYASFEGHTKVVEVLLENNKDIANYPDGTEFGFTPLLYSLFKNQYETCSLLINSGSDANYVDLKFGRNALMWAAEGDSEEIMKVIVNKITDIHQQDSDLQWTALHLAVWKDNIPFINILLDHGADPNKSNKENVPAFGLKFTYEKHQPQWLPLLLERGGDLNYTDEDGNTLLHLSVICGSVTLVKFLLQSKIDRNKRNNKGLMAEELISTLDNVGFTIKKEMSDLLKQDTIKNIQTSN